jgi:hypothetical protein
MAQTITSLEGFVRKIRQVTPAPDEVLLYRGHSNAREYKLVPSVLREVRYKEAEHVILRELVSSHPQEFADDTSTLDQLARVQHYSLPTRLLDLTWNPLAGLYFAAKEHDGIPGEVIVLRVKKPLVKFYDSDTASCIANLAHLSAMEKAAIDFSLGPDPFNEQAPIDRLLQFIRVEKPHFLSRIDPSHLKSAVVVKPKLNNRRILAQSGAFLLFGHEASLEPVPPADIGIERIRINGNKKQVIRRELDRMAMNDSSMFPEIEKAAIYIRGKL